ncbi:MAG: DNA starvation/stationary phase protection protein Dps [Acidocella sp.]|nr:DNA starvation/stationary phase protection protein Dps [Acidocella sp.]
MKLRPTKNGLPAETREAMVEVLNARLADTLDLALATRHAHWNCKGMNFIAVHTFLAGLRGDLDGYADALAGRALQLGGAALGTIQAVEAQSALDMYPVEIHTVKDHLLALVARYASLASAVRANINDADEASDAGTVDLLTDYLRGLDKQVWKLEAHLGA